MKKKICRKSFSKIMGLNVTKKGVDKLQKMHSLLDGTGSSWQSPTLSGTYLGTRRTWSTLGSDQQQPSCHDWPYHEFLFDCPIDLRCPGHGWSVKYP